MNYRQCRSKPIVPTRISINNNSCFMFHGIGGGTKYP
jgi:hypothetical protein